VCRKTNSNPARNDEDSWIKTYADFMQKRERKRVNDYSRSTLLGFRLSIERFLNAAPFSRGLQISTDPRFARSNPMLDAQIKNLKRSGKENVSHNPTIEEEDLQKLKSSEVLSLSSPLSLLRNLWFHVVLFFCRRGLEGQRSLTTNSFKFETDVGGRNYATMSHDELLKNHPGGLKDVQSMEKKPECMRPKTKVTASGPSNCISRRSIQSVLRFFSIRRKIAWLQMLFGMKHDRLE